MAGIGGLKKRAEFLAVAAARRKWVAPGLILQARERGGLLDEPRLRLGFTASRKVGNAVTRNRAKRRLRAAAREVLRAAAPEAAGLDLVLIARGETPERPFAALKRDLEYGLSKLGLARKAGRA